MCVWKDQAIMLEKDIVNPTGEVQNRPFTAAVLREDGPCDTRNYGSDDDTILSEVTKDLEPTSMIVQECISFEKRSVESVKA
jgi:hypothetical protein